MLPQAGSPPGQSLPLQNGQLHLFSLLPQNWSLLSSWHRRVKSGMLLSQPLHFPLWLPTSSALLLSPPQIPLFQGPVLFPTGTLAIIDTNHPSLYLGICGKRQIAYPRRQKNDSTWRSKTDEKKSFHKSEMCLFCSSLSHHYTFEYNCLKIRVQGLLKLSGEMEPPLNQSLNCLMENINLRCEHWGFLFSSALCSIYQPGLYCFYVCIR